MIARVVTVMLALAGAAHATPQEAIDRAARAADWLGQATLALDQNDMAEDRIVSLTRTIGAFEEGLTALRSALRQLAAEEAAAQIRLADDDVTLSALLGTLQAAARAPVANGMAHPGGPLGAARAASMIEHLTPDAATRVAALRTRLSDLKDLRAATEAGAATLRQGRAALQAARRDLVAQVAAGDSVRVAPTDQAVLDILVESARTLATFADSLATTPAAALPQPSGTWSQPVRGDRNTDGPGWRWATAPGALVTAPADVSVRYAGPLLDLGQVVIVEPAAGVLIVLAGLDTLLTAPGQTLRAGAPLGLMPPSQEKLIGPGAGQSARPSLYLEVRQQNSPVNPRPWFAQEQT